MSDTPIRVTAEQVRVVTSFVYHAAQPSSYLMDLPSDRREKYLEAAVAGFTKAGIEVVPAEPEPAPPSAELGPALPAEPEQIDLFSATP